MDEVVEQMEQHFPDAIVQATVTGSIHEGQTMLEIDTVQLHINSDWSVTPPFMFGDLQAGRSIASDSSVSRMVQMHETLQRILDNLIAYDAEPS